ncbi:COBRA-like protein 7 [Brachypodium distachyon]|uniref:COBRA-like protein 7 n=1 Tax=Brachypodium distachyon TaxID=15368 RepID=UPI0001C75A5A|nr:COBRA-like protein 7 [Brachypodium distachyon]|eukprot:XP_003559754.1 COBRA-like protein 7 [Brachypodium distachyon]
MASTIVSSLAVFFFLLLLLALAVAQPAVTPPPLPDDTAGCNGVLLTYTLQGRDRIRPFVSPADAQSQPYSFRATATVLNSGVRPLAAGSWSLLLAFAHREVLVSVSGAVLTSGADLPFNTTTAEAGALTSFSESPQRDLLTPIATAGDLARIQATVTLVGTHFAGPEPLTPPPLPSNISLLAGGGYTCSPPAVNNASLSTCCVPGNDPMAAPPLAPPTSTLSRGVSGDLVITYDVLQAHESTYLALVTLDNDAPMGRLDGWRLSWEWARGEFVGAMRGAHPLELDAGACVYGAQGEHYKDLDFFSGAVLTCARRPVILDLPPTRRDDAAMGNIEHCCRNGTLLPKSMDDAPGSSSSSSRSAFQMEVYKMPPDLNRTSRPHPPASFRISGSSPLNPDYTCGQPVTVRPSEFPDPSGLESTTRAIATWQASCNITVDNGSGGKPPQCCVSFSAFYNDSVIPCNTCACGCPAPASSASCSRTAPATLLPPHALLMPADRRAKEALKWANDEDLPLPANPPPCGDMCGVSVNWHVATDAEGGWSARVTLFNWGPGADMPDWFAAVVMDDKVYAGFEQAYSFNGTAVGNGTVFLRGREGFNELLLRESNMSGVDYPVPGKLQSVLSFTKKIDGGGDIDVVAGDGFPSKVFFNGEECAMPQRIPSKGVGVRAGISGNALLLLLLCLVLSI